MPWLMFGVMLRTTIGGREKELVDGAMKIVSHTLRKLNHMNLVEMITEEEMDLSMYLVAVVETLSMMPGYLQDNKPDIL